MILDGQDLLEALPPNVLDRLAKAPMPAAPSSECSLTPPEEKILKLLSSEASVHFEPLLDRSALAMAELNQLLLQLEMKGFIRQSPGRQFSRVLR